MNCVFCDIIDGRAEADIFYQDDEIIVFHDHNPKAPTHLLICPKKHYHDLLHTPPEVAEKLHETVKLVSEKVDTGDHGFRIQINNGSNAGQIIFHLHYHFLSSKRI